MTDDVSYQVSFYKLMIMVVIKLGERRPPQDLAIISLHFLNGNCFSSFLSSVSAIIIDFNVFVKFDFKPLTM